MKKTAFLIAPSKSCTKLDLECSMNFLHNLGFDSTNRSDIFEEYFVYAGTPRRRAEELMESLLDDGSDCVFCVKGGVGSIHFQKFIDFRKISSSKKPIVGFSDITLLLINLSQNSRIRCIHGPNLSKSFEECDRRTISSMLDCLNKRDYFNYFNYSDVLVRGRSRAKITGGNLDLIVRSMGTSAEIETSGKILFIEENEYEGRKIFDFLWQLKFSGKFDKIKGVILGYFKNSEDDPVEKYLVEFFKKFKFPVVMNQPIGHEEPNLSIPLGEKCEIDTGKKKWGINFDHK